MLALMFKVDRKRDDGFEQKVECIVPMHDERRVKIDLYSDEFDEKEYDRFCENDVPRIVREQHNLDCGYNWWFDKSPTTVEI